MKKFQLKVFGVIFGSLSLCLIAFISIFIVRTFSTQQDFVQNHLRNAPVELHVEISNPDNTEPIPNGDQNLPQDDSIDYIQSLINHANQTTTNTLIFSIFLFVFLEVVIFFVSRLLTHWVVKPVQDTFNRQKQFIADTSHELKTPISVIMASSDALAADPTETKWLKNIQSESNRMSLLVTDLLKLTTTEQPESFHFTNANFSKIVELMSLTFEAKAFDCDLKLNCEITPNIFMKLDESAIKQLVSTLLDNAFYHAHHRSTIKISLTSNNKSIILSVTNRGTAIPKDEETKIFERFYRSDKSRARKDNHFGLGLAIAKNIVTAHHGAITAHSANGLTTFQATFKNSGRYENLNHAIHSSHT